MELVFFLGVAVCLLCFILGAVCALGALWIVRLSGRLENSEVSATPSQARGRPASFNPGDIAVATMERLLSPRPPLRRLRATAFPDDDEETEIEPTSSPGASAPSARFLDSPESPWEMDSPGGTRTKLVRARVKCSAIRQALSHR